jgi:uncharacterized membrane protein
MNINRQTLVAVVLLGSLAGNIFLGGFLLGNFLGHPPGGRGGRHFPPPPPGMGPPDGPPGLGILHELSPEIRDRMRPLLEAHRQTMRPEFEKMQQAQQAVFETLMADDFDATRLAAAFSQLKQERRNIQDIMSQLLVQVASQLDKTERVELAKSMRRNPPPPPPED